MQTAGRHADWVLLLYNKLLSLFQFQDTLKNRNMINNADFWTSIASIINDGFTSEGLQKLERYAEQFISREIVYKRFSPLEQYGCAAGGTTHVIATLLAGAKTDADTLTSGISDFKRMCKRGAEQAKRIEHWANTVGIWFDNIELTLSDILGEKIAEGGEAIVYDHGATLTNL